MLERVCVWHTRRAAAESPLGTCKALSCLAPHKAQHAQVTASWGEPRGQKPEAHAQTRKGPGARSKLQRRPARKGSGGRAGGRGASQKYIKNIMAPRREESSPLITLWGFSGEQRVNLRGSSRDPEGADIEGPSPPRCRSSAGSRGLESGASPRRLPGAAAGQTPTTNRTPLPQRGGGRERPVSAGELRGNNIFVNALRDD